jgi:hypothetical protein
VLAGEALYFFGDQSVAESLEAAAERLQVQQELESPVLQQPTDLSKSPFPVLAERQHGWEKRVTLECVGAVQSAELEYGHHSFALSAGDDSDGDDKSDKLVLRARTIRAGDLHHLTRPRSRPNPPNATTGNYTSALSSSCVESPSSPVRSGGRSMLTVASFSPRYHNLIATTCGKAAPLSHGHGRNLLRRRRLEQQAKMPSKV